MASILSMSGLAVGATTLPASAGPDSIAVAKSAPATVLVGAPVTYSIAASNPASAESDFQYNLTFRDVLPADVEYVSTSAPAGLAAPEEIPEVDGAGDPTGRTILIWSNVADLPDGSEVALSYKVQPDPVAYPVGSEISNSATGYASGDERTLAKFTPDGDFIADPAISDASDTATTDVTAIALEKTEPSSEAELVRGVHDRTTTYSLEVTNNGVNPTDSVVVVDYIPAGLEFLGCGQVDNSAGDEYNESGGLESTPAVPDCLTAFSVTTVNSDLPTGYPAGVYTRVEWRLPADLAAGDTYTITYAAGIPLLENAMPAGSGFVSTANLDNNTGGSTRETGGEISYTNRAEASGLYQGPNVAGDTNVPVSDNATETVTAEDIAVAKSIKDSNKFSQGGEAQFDLVVRTSEYTDGSGIVLVDTLPDGLCPSDAPSGTYTAAATTAAAGACAPESSGNAAIEGVDFVGGVFVVTFKPFDLSAAAASTTISHQVRMRGVYNDGVEQTSAGDTFTNSVGLTGTTTPVSGTSETGTQPVKDTSTATLVSAAPVLDKRVLTNTAATHTCDDDTWSTDPADGNWQRHPGRRRRRAVHDRLAGLLPGPGHVPERHVDPSARRDRLPARQPRVRTGIVRARDGRQHGAADRGPGDDRHRLRGRLRLLPPGRRRRRLALRREGGRLRLPAQCDRAEQRQGRRRRPRQPGEAALDRSRRSGLLAARQGRLPDASDDPGGHQQDRREDRPARRPTPTARSSSTATSCATRSRSRTSARRTTATRSRSPTSQSGTSSRPDSRATTSRRSPMPESAPIQPISLITRRSPATTR